MRRLASTFLLIVFPAMISTNDALATQPSGTEQQHCRSTVKKLSSCPGIGCPSTHHPNLNPAKNRTGDAASPATMTVADVVALNSKIDPSWGEDEPVASMKSAGEGKAVSVEGYVVHVAVEKGESCNCYLSGEKNNDYHINLVGTLADAKLDSTSARMKSIVVEMTPRVRPQHSGWTSPAVAKTKLDRSLVRVTGWLMLDTAHLKGNSGGPRASLWEVHPVTRFEVKVGDQWKSL